MTLAERFAEYVRACFTGLWIESYEPEEALGEIARVCREEGWRLAVWNVDAGLQVYGAADPGPGEAGRDPLAAVRALGALAEPDGSTVLVLENFHRFLASAEIVQAVARQVLSGKQSRTFIVVLAPVVKIPPELERRFAVLEHELPGRSELLEIARGVAVEAGELPEGPELETVLEAAGGLTRYEAENAYSLALIRSGRITAETIWDLKTQALKKSGLLQLYRGQEDFSRLGGLTSLKAFCKRALRRTAGSHPLRRPRGVLLLSPPGCGKSQFAKALGKETGRPVLLLDVGSLMGSLVGQTEERTRQAIRIIDAMAPCIVMIDELEKAFAGVAGSGQADSGVASRMFGSFLTWLADHESDAFVVCTSNDVSKLPPELSRAERFDGVFFLDLPGPEERRAIWSIYLDLFQIDRSQRLPDDASWTGAEIRSCCRLAALLDVPLTQAAQNVVPVAKTAAESVERLRQWASGRCLSADHPGLYQHPGAGGKARRKIPRDPSVN